MKKWKQWILLLMACPLLLSGCSFSQKLAGSAYDSNKKIAGSFSSYNLVNSRGSADRSTVSGIAEGFSGVDTIWSCTVTEETTVSISYALQTSGGQLKMVLVRPDNSVIILAELSGTDGIASSGEPLVLHKGENRIRLVSRDGRDVHYELQASEGEAKPLG